MKFERKIGEFDPTQFGKDPFEDVRPPEPKTEDPFERIGEILGYVLMGIVLGGIGAVIVKIAMDAWF